MTGKQRFINMGSIDQFRTTIKNVQHMAQYVRYDEDTQETIMDRTAKMPTVTVTASEKIHGTNMGVCFSNSTGFYVQSRKNIITPEKDNGGCAFQAMQNKEEWMKIILDLAEDKDINLDEKIITVYAEWSGGNIQKLSAVSGLDKRAIIFQHFKVSNIIPTEEESSYWLETHLTKQGDHIGGWVKSEENNIFNIMSFDVWQFEVDFETPALFQNEFIKLVEEKIEPDSPLGRHMGVENNIGEGAVFTFIYKHTLHRFNVKGTKHSSSRVKTLKPVDNEKEQAKIDFAIYATPAWRLEQMYDLANDTINGGEPLISNIGTFIKFVNKDILKEESDEMASRGLEPKEIFGTVARIIKVWYQEQLDINAGLV